MVVVKLAGKGRGWPCSSPSLSPRSPPLSPPHSALLREPALRDPEQLGGWILKGRRRGRKMTLADVASVGAGRRAAGHLPAPWDPGACALRLGPQRARPQPNKIRWTPPPPQWCSLSGGGMLGVVGFPLSTSRPPPSTPRLKWVGAGRWEGRWTDG